jgi:mono/diheme cytochrome c family protein
MKLRRSHFVVAALVAIGLLVAVLHQRGVSRLAPVAVSANDASPRMSADLRAHGRRLVRDVHRCQDCHGDDLEGAVVADVPFAGRLIAPALAGRADIAVVDLAVRHGLTAEGRPLLVMPSELYAGLSDRELAAIASYLASLPSPLATRETTRWGVGLFALVGAGLVHVSAHRIAQVHAASDQRGDALDGRTVAGTWGCLGCHGGGDGDPPPPPLDAARLGRWTRTDFGRAVRSGVRPDGSRLDAAMPSPAFASLTDDELDALYRLVMDRGIGANGIATP